MLCKVNRFLRNDAEDIKYICLPKYKSCFRFSKGKDFLKDVS